MPYAIPQANSIHFDLSGDYQSICGRCLDIRLGEQSQVCAIWYPDGGDSVDASFSGEYIPAAELVDFEFNETCYPGQPDEIVPVEPLPVNGGSKRIRWGKLRRVDCRVAAPWQDMAVVDRDVKCGFAQVENHLQAPVRLPWAESNKTDRTPVAARWAGLARKDERTTRIPWINPGRMERTVRAPWGKIARLEVKVVAPWVNMLAYIDQRREMPWGKFEKLNPIFTFTWANSLPRKDFLYRAYWGRELYERICMRGYEPPAGDVIDLHLDTPISQVDDGANIRFYFDRMSYDLRCNQREPSGWRDPYTYVPPVSWPVAPKLATYINMNTALLKRVSDNAPVEIRSMELASDIDSWCWSFTARVPEESLSLVMPLAEPVEVEAEINGYKWIVLVEGWSESAAFGRREYTIRGRSASALLADPYAPVISGSNTATATARQLAEEQLLNTGWTIDWGVVDWLVSAGVLSYSNSQALKVIQRIVETAGGRVMCHRTAKQLLTLPRLHSLPWTWATATPDLGISDYVVRQLSREFVKSTAYNGVFVSGESQGVLTKVFRSGTAGDEVAPMVTDALITDVEPAREMGRMIIGQGGKWSREGLELFLAQSGTLPGLLEVGQLVEMSERGTPWRGQVVGVQVVADRSRGLRVSQNIDVERWYGD